MLLRMHFKSILEMGNNILIYDGKGAWGKKGREPLNYSVSTLQFVAFRGISYQQGNA